MMCLLQLLLTARRYASARTATALRLSVCLSQVGVLSKWMDGSSWFLACRLLLTYPTLCCNEIQVSTKMRALSSGTLSQTQDSEILLRHIDRRTCYQLSSRKVDAQSVIYWTVVIFYRVMQCIRGTSHGTVSVRLSVRPSVCPSQVGVLLKRLNVGSHNQHHTIPRRL